MRSANYAKGSDPRTEELIAECQHVLAAMKPGSHNALEVQFRGQQLLANVSWTKYNPPHDGVAGKQCTVFLRNLSTDNTLFEANFDSNGRVICIRHGGSNEWQCVEYD